MPGMDGAKELILLNDGKMLFDGKESEYDYKFINDYVLILRVDGNNYVLTSEMHDEDDGKFTSFNIDVHSEKISVICKSELDLLVEKLSSGKSNDKFKNDVLSPMPGVIVKISVTEGQKVKKGDVMLVLEAMKMENEIKCAMDCTVKKIIVEEKMAVDKEQLLMKLEPV